MESGTPYRAQVLEDAYLRMMASGVFTDVAFPTVRLAGNGGVDAVIVVTNHDRVDYGLVAQYSPCVIDTRNVYRPSAAGRHPAVARA